MLRISAFLPTTRTGVRGYGHRGPRERKYFIEGPEGPTESMPFGPTSQEPRRRSSSKSVLSDTTLLLVVIHGRVAAQARRASAVARRPAWLGKAVRTRPVPGVHVERTPSVLTHEPPATTWVVPDAPQTALRHDLD